MNCPSPTATIWQASHDKYLYLKMPMLDIFTVTLVSAASVFSNYLFVHHEDNAAE